MRSCFHTQHVDCRIHLPSWSWGSCANNSSKFTQKTICYFIPANNSLIFRTLIRTTWENLQNLGDHSVRSLVWSVALTSHLYGNVRSLVPQTWFAKPVSLETSELLCKKTMKIPSNTSFSSILFPKLESTRNIKMLSKIQRSLMRISENKNRSFLQLTKLSLSSNSSSNSRLPLRLALTTSRFVDRSTQLHHIGFWMLICVLS